MITNVELDLKLNAEEFLRKLLPGVSNETLDDYELLYVRGNKTDYGRKPVREVSIRLRKKLKDGKIL